MNINIIDGIEDENGQIDISSRPKIQKSKPPSPRVETEVIPKEHSVIDLSDYSKLKSALGMVEINDDTRLNFAQQLEKVFQDSASNVRAAVIFTIISNIMFQMKALETLDTNLELVV
jgi:hypothetical protein